MGFRRISEPLVLSEARARLLEAAPPPTQRPPDPVLQHAEVVAPLLQATGWTCAYCERPLTGTGPDGVVVTHHRPTWGAMAADGTVTMGAYGWLALVWDNLRPACADCVRAKGTRFPVDGPRATPDSDLAAERAVLLDPAVDDPDPHLRFQPDGTVAAITQRGRVTIEVLALNREPLVRARAGTLSDGAGPQFATMRRQLAAPSPAPGARELEAAPPPPSLPVGPALPQQGNYDLNTDLAAAEKQQYFQATQWVERVVIRNFRPIRELEVDLSRSSSEQGPWTVLLGENGSGKSSILQAVALTLMGGEQRRRLGIDARSYLRHRAHKGMVQVFLSGNPEPLELRWEHGDAEFTGPEPVPALLLGYCATRLLPRHADGPPDQRVVRVDNLFDPLLPLTDPTSWLLSLDDDTFAEVADGIHELLALSDDAELVRTGAGVRLRQGNTESDLTTLSDGYQAMVVMSCDILRSVLTMWPRAALAEGIVLIDEVGAHLHPRWRMRIVTAVRRLLPRVQFIISTHDPLCLRGVLDGEVVVVRRNSDGDVVTIVDLPSVQGMRIDQLLTSEHFGLGSTDDPEVADLWETYYALQAVARPNAGQRERLDAVRARLGELEQLGSTERERYLMAAADRYIAQRRETGDAVAPAPDAVVAELSRLWSENLPTEAP
ncbi:hypothetical protein GCM10028820_04440 [Tessaracoccus terricola]